MMKVSVIVPTFNGAGKIKNLLDALLKQTYSDFELIIAIDGSTDHTRQLVDNYRSSFRSLKIIESVNVGRSKIRNQGVKESIGEWLVFYDDDMIPYPDSIEKHVARQQKQPVLLAGYPLEMKSKNKSDVQNYKAMLNLRWMCKYGDGETIMDQDNLFFTAANCSMNRTTFDELGGFDESLTDSEDYDLARRALILKILVVLDLDNKAIHNELITAKSYTHRLREYSSANRKIRQVSPIHSIKKVIYGCFAHRFWIRCIDGEFLNWMPRYFRYKLYDVIFQAFIEYPQVFLH